MILLLSFLPAVLCSQNFKFPVRQYCPPLVSFIMHNSSDATPQQGQKAFLGTLGFLFL